MTVVNANWRIDSDGNLVSATSKRLKGLSAPVDGGDAARFDDVVGTDAASGLSLIQSDALTWFDARDALPGLVATISSRHGSDPKTATIASTKTPQLVDGVMVHDGVDDVLRTTTSALGGLTNYSFVFAGSALFTTNFKTAFRIGNDPYPCVLFRADNTSFGIATRPTLSTTAANAMVTPSTLAGDVGYRHPLRWAGMHTFIGVREGANLRFYIDGQLVAKSTLTNNAVTAGSLDWAIGGSTADGAYQADAEWTESGLFGRALSPSEVSDLHAHCSRRWSKGTMILIEGNSLSHNSVHGEEGWVNQFRKAGLGQNVHILNHAAGGATTTQLVSRFYKETAQICRPGRQVSVVWECGNDMYAPYTNLSGAAAAAKAFELCDLLRPYGPVVLADVPARGDLTGTRRVDCNAILAADYADHADFLVQLSLRPELDDENDATYVRPDKVHYYSLGYGAVADAFRPAIMAAVGMVNL